MSTWRRALGLSPNTFPVSLLSVRAFNRDSSCARLPLGVIQIITSGRGGVESEALQILGDSCSNWICQCGLICLLHTVNYLDWIKYGLAK